MLLFYLTSRMHCGRIQLKIQINIGIHLNCFISCWIWSSAMPWRLQYEWTSLALWLSSRWTFGRRTLTFWIQLGCRLSSVNSKRAMTLHWMWEYSFCVHVVGYDTEFNIDIFAFQNLRKFTFNELILREFNSASRNIKLYVEVRCWCRVCWTSVASTFDFFQSFFIEEFKSSREIMHEVLKSYKNTVLNDADLKQLFGFAGQAEAILDWDFVRG